MGENQGIAVMGDWGYDHIVVPFSHNPKSYDEYQDKGGKPEHIFGAIPTGAANSEKCVEAGSLLTYTLLKGLTDKHKSAVEFLPRLEKELGESGSKIKAFWRSYSKWLLHRCKTAAEPPICHKLLQELIEESETKILPKLEEANLEIKAFWRSYSAWLLHGCKTAEEEFESKAAAKPLSCQKLLRKLITESGKGLLPRLGG
jgi:hypothetical protein